MPTLNLPRWLLALFLALTVFPAAAAGPADLADNPEADALTEALVRRRLAADDLVNFHRIEVQVSDGVVSLRGTARTRQTRDAVLREVGKVSGVVSVLDKIEVEPTP
ncbi:BON domain-containing protein [Tahibacter aquaticus]|uniref:BON domain-containing protein n=1 Tax=Tahibacter aquaticus TaxID=520092 RepID=A0A4R6Z4G3_9GAMM|nr:BON domain-containing protein [Tahibacter aquaticus]TDR46550.1 BON domain-containing protein [Tahibacter aquaticus]